MTTIRHQTNIQWTWLPGYSGATWNPTVGCTRVSPGCDNCYAFQLHDQRYAANLKAARRSMAGAVFGPVVIQQARKHGIVLPCPPQYDVPFSTVQLLDEKRLTAPLRAKAPRAYFVDSMSDLFHEDVPDDFIDRVFAVMALAPQHLFMILTKRPERMRAYVSAGGLGVRGAIVHLPASTNPHPALTWPLPNVWLGFSAEDQQRFDERWPHLRDTPAAVRFVSMEPLLDGIDPRRALEAWECAECGYHPAERGVWSRPRRGCPICSEDKGDEGRIIGKTHLDWVIVGGESGRRARRFDLVWARRLVAQCRTAGVPVFVKQLGAHPSVDLYRDEQGAEFPTGEHIPLRLRNRHGSDMSEWPDDLKIRKFPRLV